MSRKVPLPAQVKEDPHVSILSSVWGWVGKQGLSARYTLVWLVTPSQGTFSVPAILGGPKPSMVKSTVTALEGNAFQRDTESKQDLCSSGGA